MAVKVNINSNIKTFTKGLDNFSKVQVPNATRSTLNNVASDLRKHIIDVVFPKSFTMRNRGFPKLLFRFKKATRDKLVSSVFQKPIDGRVFDVITKSATGGVKRGNRGRVAVPTSNIRLTSKGIRADRRPRTIVNNPKGFVKGNKIFFQKNKKSLQLLYILKNFVKIRKTFPFEEKSRLFVEKNLEKVFNKALAFRINKARF